MDGAGGKTASAKALGRCDRTGEVARKGQAVESAVSLGLGIPPK